MTKPRNERSRPRTIWRAFAWLAGLVLLLAVAAWLARARIVDVMAVKLARSAGFELTLGRVDAPSFRTLEFHDVTFAPIDETDALRSIAIDRLRVEFALRDLVTGGLAGLRAIDGSGLHVSVDLTLPPSGKPSSGPPVFDVLSDIAKLLPDSVVQEASLELIAPSVGVVRAEHGVLRVHNDRLELNTPIDALGGRADAELAVADGRLVARIDARRMGWDGRTVDWVRGTLAVDSAMISARDLWIANGSSIAEVPYFDLPLPIRDLCSLRESARGAVRLEVHGLPEILAEAIGRDAAEAFPAHRLELEGRVQDGYVDLGPGRLSTEHATFVLERGRAPIADTLREVILDPTLDVALSADIGDVSVLGELLAPIAGTEPWSGRVEAELRIRGGPHGPVGSADIFASRVRALGRQLDWLAAEATIDAERVFVSRLDARIPGASVFARGGYSLEGRRFDGVELSAEVPDLRVLEIDGLTAGRAHIQVSGGGTWRSPMATVEITARDVVWRESDPAWVHVHARAHGNRPLAIDTELDSGCEHLSVRGELKIPKELSGSASGESSAWRARIDALRATSDASTLELAAPCELVLSNGAFEIAGLHLTGSAGDARIDVALGPKTGRVRAKMSAFDPAPLRRFVPLGFECSRIDGNVEAEWTRGDLVARVDGSCRDLSFDPTAPSLDVTFRAEFKDHRLSIAGIEASTAGEPLISLRGSLPLDPSASEWLPDGEIELQGSVALRDLSLLPAPLLEKLRVRTGTLFADVELEGTSRAPRGRIVVGGAHILWPHDAALGPWSCAGTIELDEDVHADALEIELEGGARTVIDGRISDLDAIASALAAGAPLPDSMLELDVEFRAADLASFAGRAPVRLRRLAGGLTGDLKVRGTLRTPDIKGALHLENGELRTTTTLPPIQGLSAHLAFDTSSVKIERVTGELGGAPFQLTGSYDFAGDAQGAHLELTGENLLLYRQSDLTLRADAKLSIEGPPGALVIGGEIALSDSRFTREIDWLALPTSKARRASVRGIEIFSVTEPPLANARFDIAVRSKEPLRIAARRVQGGLRPDLRLIGSGRLPILVGTILVEPTRVRLPASTILVRSGHIEFLASDPFVPRLEISADARLRGYDVTIGVTGEFDRPVVTLASAPPLAREDLLLLVLTGRAPGLEGGSVADLDAAGDVVVYLAGDVMDSIFGSASVDDESMVDRFTLESGQDVTQKGAPTMHASLLVRRDVTRKNDELYFTGERDVYDRYNYGLRLVFRFP
jgi:autotransporter translocation and assembly factor TamB